MRGGSSNEQNAGGVDPIDVELERAGATARRPSHRGQHRGWLTVDCSTGSMPVVILLLLGAGLGPRGLSILTPAALALMDPAAPVALAAIGVVAAFGIDLRRPRERRVVAAASAQAALTVIVVTAGIVIAGPAFSTLVFGSPWTLALLTGVCASTSSSLPLQDSTVPQIIVERVGAVDGLLPIIVGALVLAILRETSIPAAALLLAQSAMIALCIAVVGWLLLSRATSDTEQRVFSVAALLLLGGVSDYLSMSALFAGLVAGTFWQVLGGRVPEAVRRDIGYVEHPLLVLVLLLAGARVGLSPTLLPLAAAYVVLRTMGKLAGGWCATRLMGSPPGDMGRALIAPGIFGVAFAVNGVRAVGPDVMPVLTAVVTGTIASSLLSCLVRNHQGAE